LEASSSFSETNSRANPLSIEHLRAKLRIFGWSATGTKSYLTRDSTSFNIQVLVSDVILKTNFLRSWFWPWTVLRIWKIAVLRPKRWRPQFLDQN